MTTSSALLSDSHQHPSSPHQTTSFYPLSSSCDADACNAAFRSLTDKCTLTGLESDGNIGCMTESRGSASEVGLAIFNIATSVCYIFQILDSPTYINTIKLLSQHCVKTIIFNESSLSDHTQSKLALSLVNTVSHDKLLPGSRQLFNSEKGLRYIMEYCIRSKSKEIILDLDKKYYAQAAVGALFSYFADTLGLLPCSIDCRVESPDEFILIDASSASSLELVTSKPGSLLEAIDKTLTKMGHRQLKNLILQPLKKAKSIKKISDSVAVLASDLNGLQVIRDQLKDFSDVDQMISGIIRNPKSENTKIPEKNIQLVLMMQEVLMRTHCITEFLQERSYAAYFAETSEKLRSSEILSLGTKIDNLLSPDVIGKRRAYLSQSNRCYAIRTGQDVLLDVARKTLKETTDDIYEYSEATAKSLELSLKLKYAPKKGFSLLVSKPAGVPDYKLPDGMFLQSQTKDLIYCSTLELMKLNHRIKESLDEIFLITDKLITAVLEEARQSISIFYQLSEGIGQLDLCCSAAEYSLSTSTVFPEFGAITAIRNGRHPVLEKVGHSCVPNDFFCSYGHEFTLISGINMSGKTTYLKTLAMIFIMAQIGYPVPCDFASVSIRESIFCRFGSDDDLETNCSSFLREVLGVAHCLHSVNSKSLVLIDELGRGTSISDGLAITTSIFEEFIKRKTYVFAVTHYQRLIQYLHSVPNVNLLTLQASEQGEHFNFSYRAAEGTSNIEGYGIKLARLTGLPKKLIDDAVSIKKKIESCEDQCNSVQVMLKRKIKKRRLIYETAGKLKIGEVDDDIRLELKRDFTEKLNQINELN